jgi:hypothetical protein
MRLCRASWRRNRASSDQLDRDRGVNRNIFDALTNQAGWGGFVASDLARCRHSDPERIASRDPMAARRA